MSRGGFLPSSLKASLASAAVTISGYRSWRNRLWVCATDSSYTSRGALCRVCAKHTSARKLILKALGNADSCHQNIKNSVNGMLRLTGSWPFSLSRPDVLLAMPPRHASQEHPESSATPRDRKLPLPPTALQESLPRRTWECSDWAQSLESELADTQSDHL